MKVSVKRLIRVIEDLLGTEGSIHGGNCLHCGRVYDRQGEYAIPDGGDCPSDDCPSFDARKVLRQLKRAGNAKSLQIS
jgi:hypothetical protein